MFRLRPAALVVSALGSLFGATALEAQTTGPSLPDRAYFPSTGSSNPLVTEGDRWYLRRQEGRVGSKASVGPINRAIAEYDRAVEAPDLVEGRWKLARALYFKGVYCGLDPDARKAIFVKARRVSEEAIGILNRSLEQKGIKGLLDLTPELLAGTLSDRSDAAPIYFWAAASWGQWALSTGKAEAARTGVPETIRDYALTVVALDPKFEEGGGYRILGRLNDEAPWIPFITGWVSREEAIRSLRLAVEAGPQNIANRHYLAEALAKGNAEEKAEAIRLEEAILVESPSPLHIVEDLTIQDAARANLAAWKKGA
jgi:tetratricopeptide (TPR) repeat protein